MAPKGEPCISGSFGPQVATYQGKPFWGYPIFDPQPRTKVSVAKGRLTVNDSPQIADGRRSLSQRQWRTQTFLGGAAAGEQLSTGRALTAPAFRTVYGEGGVDLRGGWGFGVWSFTPRNTRIGAVSLNVAGPCACKAKPKAEQLARRAPNTQC